jgi:HEAT repeat protein
MVTSILPTPDELISLLKDCNLARRKERIAAKAQLLEYNKDELIHMMAGMVRDENKYYELIIGFIPKIDPINGILLLVDLLAHKKPSIRYHICGTLSNYADFRVQAPLLKQLTDEDVDVRSVATWALGKIGTPEVIPTLLNLAETDASIDNKGFDIRFTALEAIQTINARQSRKKRRVKRAVLLEILDKLHSLDPKVRQSVPRQLRFLGIERSVAGLKGLLKDSDSEIRCRAAVSIMMLLEHDGLLHILPLFDDEDATVRWLCCGLLEDLGKPVLITPFVKWAVTDDDNEVRYSAVMALGKLGDNDLIPILRYIEAYDEGETYDNRSIKRAAQTAIQAILARNA